MHRRASAGRGGAGYAGAVIVFSLANVALRDNGPYRIPEKCRPGYFRILADSGGGCPSQPHIYGNGLTVCLKSPPKSRAAANPRETPQVNETASTPPIAARTSRPRLAARVRLLHNEARLGLLFAGAGVQGRPPRFRNREALALG